MSSLLPIILCVLIAGFFGGSENGAYRLSRIRLRRAALRGSRSARLLQRCVAHMERFVCMTLAAGNVAVYGATIFCTALVTEHLGTRIPPELTSTLILSPILLVFSEVLPKSLFQTLADRIMRWASPLLWITGVVLWPVVQLLLAVVSFWRYVLGGRSATPQATVTPQHLTFMLAEGAQEGVITPEQDSMARNIMEFGTRPLREVMIPLTQVRMIPQDASREDVLQVIGERVHARLPVYVETRDKVTGILLILDYLCEGKGAAVRDFIRETLYLEHDLPVNVAFRRLQDAGQTMGIVTDADDRAIGIATIGDFLQQIFGTLEAA